MRQTIRAAEGAGLDLTAVRRHGGAGDGGLLRYAGAMVEDGGSLVDAYGLNALRLQLDGTPFRLLLAGAEGKTCLVRTSPDLADWQSLTTLTISNTAVQFIDVAVTNRSPRFYRAISQP